MTRAVLPERVTLHLWDSGIFTTRAQCRQPRLSQRRTRLAPAAYALTCISPASPGQPSLTYDGFMSRLLQGAIIC